MTDEMFLQCLYKAVLRRDPDDSGFSHHLAWLKSNEADESRYLRLLTAFVDGEEFRYKFIKNQYGSSSNAYIPDLSHITFEYAMSVGTFCHSAMALKLAGFKSFSGPFDWIFSGPGMVEHCIRDDFNMFLDEKQYREVPVAQRSSPELNRCDHIFYRDNYGVKFVFNHHDPHESANDRAYLQRCVMRARQVMASDKWKLFFMMSNNSITNSDLLRVLGALEDRSDNFLLVAINLNPASRRNEPSNGTAGTGIRNHALRTERIRHNLLKVDFDLVSRSNGTAFLDEGDNQVLANFLSTFKVGSASLSGRPSGAVVGTAEEPA